MAEKNNIHIEDIIDVIKLIIELNDVCILTYVVTSLFVFVSLLFITVSNLVFIEPIFVIITPISSNILEVLPDVSNTLFIVDLDSSKVFIFFNITFIMPNMLSILLLILVIFDSFLISQ